ncbi:hypothetical protein [uncultured Cetobacterium sp.]|uniref:hypothetical protein n=1 Tax=uncultured Cetobacterium sp. TaxID=527638 RepID=UPI0025DDF68F|nr:hypothetical protein [uncultured Cetobacterium sp.]
MSTMKNQTNYIFSHVVLKSSFFEEEKGFTDIFFKGEDKEVKKLLEIMWDKSYEMMGEENTKDKIVKQEFNCKIARGEIENDFLYWALEVPNSEYLADSKYVGVLYKLDTKEIEYITFEKSCSFGGGLWIKNLINKLKRKPKEEPKEQFFIGGWTPEMHLNYGMENDCNFEEFVELLTKRLSK